MISAPTRMRIPGPLVGIGVDLCETERFVGLRTRWRGRMERVFAATEIDAFPGARLGWCWAAREAIVKALRTRMLGSPLVDMVVAEPTPGQLVYRPRERARLQLDSFGVTRVSLLATTIGGVAAVLALAHGRSVGPRPDWEVAWGALPWRDRSAASRLARRAGELALRQIVGTSGVAVRWSGGHGSPPDVTLGPDGPDALVSLSHDGGLSGALVAVRDP